MSVQDLVGMSKIGLKAATYGGILEFGVRNLIVYYLERVRKDLVN